MNAWKTHIYVHLLDTSRIVADSVRAGKPIIIVAMNYRLNLLGFGDGKGTAEVNLSLKDQALAIDWVREYISGFGGDPVSTYHQPQSLFNIMASLIEGPPRLIKILE